MTFDISDNYPLIWENVQKHLARYLRGNPSIQSLIIGLSGGIDSSLTCIIANSVVKKFEDIQLVGRSLPIETNTKEEVQRAEAVGRLFCDDFETKDLSEAYQLYSRAVLPQNRREDRATAENIRKGNIKARMRMMYLFDLAHFYNGMVLSTDNFTELLLGFWTLHGDVGNFGLLQYLWKTEVYGLAEFVASQFRQSGDTDKAEALKISIDAVPTDGLGITSSDFDQIQVPTYYEADVLLMDFLNGNSENKDHPVIKRYEATMFKRNDPVNIKREQIFQP